MHDSPYSMKGTPFGYSPLVQEDMLHLSQLSVYADASETFARFTNREISPSQYQRVVQYYGDKLGDQIEYTQQKPVDKSVHYTMVDGSMVFTDDGWKEIKVGRHFSSDDVHEIGNNKRREIRQSLYHAQMIDSTSFTKNMDVLIERALPKYGKHVFLNDGAVWIENWIAERYPNAVSILDFQHGIGHVSDAVKALTPDTQKQQDLLITYKTMILEGNVLKVVAMLAAKAKKSGKEIDGVLQYLRHNAYRMKYDEYLEDGLLIGSGAIEAAHRTVIQSRMKLSGQRWVKAGVDAMLKLRTRYESKKWDTVKNKILEVNFNQLDIAA